MFVVSCLVLLYPGLTLLLAYGETYVPLVFLVAEFDYPRFRASLFGLGNPLLLQIISSLLI